MRCWRRISTTSWCICARPIFRARSASGNFEATYRNDSAHIVTGDVNKTIEHLLQHDIPLDHLRIRARNLEDLFLELTGKELRA